VDGIGLVLTTESFLEEKMSPAEIKDDQSTPLKLHNTADALTKDADALKSPSSSEQ
jgi:hypothetical protein